MDTTSAESGGEAMKRFACFCGAIAALATLNGAPADYFGIRVVDEETSRGVPLVKLTTVNGIDFVTDSGGWVAFDEAGLMDRSVYFKVETHGYSIRPDGMGSPGRTLQTTRGGSTTVTVHRENIAQRLYRITGQGIYRDSVLLGHAVPIKQPILNASVIGQDSTLVTIYNGKLFWAWGDTSNPAHPLAANFRTTCATSELPQTGGLDPEAGVDLSYLEDNQFTKKMVTLEGQNNLFWLGGLLALKDENGTEQLVSNCSRIQGMMTTTERMLVRYNPEKREFERIRTLPENARVSPGSHPFMIRTPKQNYYYHLGEALTRVRADYKSVTDYSAYEALTCLKQGIDFTTSPQALDRDADGRLVYSFKPNTAGIGPNEESQLTSYGVIRANERRMQILNPISGKAVLHHGGSIYWNPWRQRWVDIFTESFGTSVLGEIWYSEADNPEGPWVYATKIMTHNDYSFYNPVQHPHFAKENGRVVFFEGTYTREFSGTKTGTPRYDYNQIMYKLNLDDAKLVVPVPIYREVDGTFVTRQRQASPVFYACDLPRENTVPVFGKQTLTLTANGEKPLFHALQVEDVRASGTTVLLGGDGKVAESTSTAVCRVWENPVTCVVRGSSDIICSAN